MLKAPTQPRRARSTATSSLARTAGGCLALLALLVLIVSGSAVAAAPPGATALCRDGTYSFSQHHSGTCSYHGGVAKWLDGSTGTGGTAGGGATATTAPAAAPAQLVMPAAARL
jgi:Protein of unknown function (DUF3761)